MDTYFGEPIKPCSDCLNGLCTMNCSGVAMKPGTEFGGWRAADSAPRDGRHILVCSGPYSEHWGFAQLPPKVVHYFEDGFYLSSGIVQGSYNDAPQSFTHWQNLGGPPVY